MRIEFTGRLLTGSGIKKFTFLVYDIDSLQGFLVPFLENIELFNLFRFNSDSQIGFVLHSNIKFDAIPLYIPVNKPDQVNNSDLIQRLEKISVSTSMFLDLNQPFEIVVAVLNVD